MDAIFGLLFLLALAGMVGGVIWAAFRFDKSFDRRLDRIRLREVCARCGAPLGDMGPGGCCARCGTPVAPVRCRSCGCAITADLPFCPGCGLSTRKYFCVQCDYNLAGVTGDRCPECGARIAPPTELENEQRAFPSRESAPNS